MVDDDKASPKTESNLVPTAKKRMHQFLAFCKKYPSQVTFGFGLFIFFLFSAHFGILIAGSSATYYAWKITRNELAWKIGVPVTLVLTVFCFYFFGTYTRTYSQKGNRVQDTYQRWGNRPIYRKIWAEYEKETFLLSANLSESGEPHGPCRMAGPNGRMILGYFWYGEKITEGEWHLRNK